MGLEAECEGGRLCTWWPGFSCLQNLPAPGLWALLTDAFATVLELGLHIYPLPSPAREGTGTAGWPTWKPWIWGFILATIAYYAAAAAAGGDNTENAEEEEEENEGRDGRGRGEEICVECLL